ncbi:MAG TPA: DUF5681 domain-containing protein [Desulfobacterales bacterium]|nr:DUF5681 domain-containing protein [Desulfobacterales bacterium]
MENTKFKPGQSGNPNGKPKGIMNRKSVEWIELHEYLLGEGLNRFAQLLRDSDDDKFIKLYIQILEYFKPKQARIYHDIPADTPPINIKIVGVKREEREIVAMD